MLSEVAGHKMISLVASYTGGATTPALSETSNSRHMEASIKAQMPPLQTNPETPASNSRGKLKVPDLNEFFICFLCRGYKIEATTINECMHSFCRSCIVKHLEVKHYCPECFHKKFVVNSTGNGNMLRIGIANGSQPNTVQTPRIITSQNLHIDHALSALIYKTVPGLYQREIGNVQKFYDQKSDDLKPNTVEAHQCSSFERILFQNKENEKVVEEEPVYVSADEPISLSLEYHPSELQGLSQISPENIPKVQYLQCPAGVRIRHLGKFICSKFSINPQDYNVELIYEDSILHKDFNLMDVVYCFNWQRDAPMRFFYRIFFTGQAELPRLRMKMVVKDNDGTKKKQEPVAKSSSAFLPPITMRIKHDLHSNGANGPSQNEKTQAENKIKLSHIIGSSSPSQDWIEQQQNNNINNHNNRGNLRKGDNHNRPQQTDGQTGQSSGADKKAENATQRAGEKRKLKDDYEFVDEVTISKLPKGAKSPSSSAMRSPQHRPQQNSPKSVTFNDTVQATRIPLITYVNPVSASGSSSSSSSPPNDFKRLRSNDIVSSGSLSASGLSPPAQPKLPSNSSSSTTSSSSSASASSNSSTKNVTSFAATNDSSRITSGTVPDNNFKQFPSSNSNRQQPQHQPSTQLHTSSSSSAVAVAAAQQISSKQQQQTKSNTQQLHNNNKLEKFPNNTLSSSALSAKDEAPAIGNNNRHQNSSSSGSTQQQQQQQKKKSSEHGDANKNDFNGNLRHEKNHNVADSTKSVSVSVAVENRTEQKQREEEDKIEYVKNIGLKPIHEVLVVDKNKDVEARRKATEPLDDSSSMLYHKKKKKSKHSKDFPFADVKKKKVDYDLAITSSNVPKTSNPARDANGSSASGNNASRSETHPPESLKMKFVKVTTSDKNKVMVIPKVGEKEPTNGRSMSSSSSSSSNKSPSPPKVTGPAPLPALSTSTGHSQSSSSGGGNKSPKGGHSPKIPKLSNFIIKDSSMEIHQIPKNSQPPKKSPSPPSLTITSTSSGPVSRGPAQPMPTKPMPHSGHGQPPKRTQSLSSGGPPAKRPHIPLQHQRSVDNSSSSKEMNGGATPFPQRSYSYDPSIMMGSTYNPLLPFQLQMAQQMLWAQAAAKQASANAVPPPAPMMPFFNAPMPQSRTPPGHPSPPMATSKKPVPPLVPPSSLGKYNPVPNLVAASGRRLQEKPPMVEIARLPPGLDKVEIPHIPVKVAPKANRPPPPTIPLVKIRRASANSTSSTESGDGMAPSRPRDAPAVLDLSSGKPASEERKVGGTTSSQKPLPQLNEISKISRSGGSHALNYRQQSASVRSVPNPSALALRNQMPQSAAAVKGPSVTSSMSPSRMSPPAMASFTSKSSNLEKLASKIKEGAVSTK